VMVGVHFLFVVGHMVSTPNFVQVNAFILLKNKK